MIGGLVVCHDANLPRPREAAPQIVTCLGADPPPSRTPQNRASRSDCGLRAWACAARSRRAETGFRAPASCLRPAQHAFAGRRHKEKPHVIAYAANNVRTVFGNEPEAVFLVTRHRSPTL